MLPLLFTCTFLSRRVQSCLEQVHVLEARLGSLDTKVGGHNVKLGSLHTEVVGQEDRLREHMEDGKVKQWTLI